MNATTTDDIMADLFMTIDSDSDSGVKDTKQKAKSAKSCKKNQDDEEILLAHSVILQDTHEGLHTTKKHTKGHIVGSNNLWNFSESLQVD